MLTRLAALCRGSHSFRQHWVGESGLVLVTLTTILLSSKRFPLRWLESRRFLTRSERSSTWDSPTTSQDQKSKSLCVCFHIVIKWIHQQGAFSFWFPDLLVTGCVLLLVSGWSWRFYTKQQEPANSTESQSTSDWSITWSVSISSIDRCSVCTVQHHQRLRHKGCWFWMIGSWMFLNRQHIRRSSKVKGQNYSDRHHWSISWSSCCCFLDLLHSLYQNLTKRFQYLNMSTGLLYITNVFQDMCSTAVLHC